MTSPEWKMCYSTDEMTTFYNEILPKIREVARQHGYAIGLHGSLKRDLDLIAVPWIDNYSSPDELANAVFHVCTGMTRTKNEWEEKPNRRIATSIPVCWCQWEGCRGIKSLGHVDLSVIV